MFMRRFPDTFGKYNFPSSKQVTESAGALQMHCEHSHAEL